MKRLATFDAADYLDSEEVIAEYINAALEDENPDVFLQAIADVAKARGMTQLAKATGLGRESLYKALSPGAKPRYDTVLRLVKALGIDLHATSQQRKRLSIHEGIARGEAAIAAGQTLSHAQAEKRLARGQAKRTSPKR